MIDPFFFSTSDEQRLSQFSNHKYKITESPLSLSHRSVEGIYQPWLQGLATIQVPLDIHESSNGDSSHSFQIRAIS